MGAAVPSVQASDGGAVRTRAKVDANHGEIMEALHKAGIAAKSLAPMGKGFPDAVASLRSYTCLLEFKVPGGELTPAQVQFIATWPGDVWVVESGPQAVERVIEGARKVFVADVEAARPR